MLSKFFKSKLLIYAPLNGKIIPIEEVPDPVFNQKMMGNGVAIIPFGGKVHSPIEGTVVLLSDTKHAIGLRSKNGTEILIHIGLETVSLRGSGFTVLVTKGESVSVGQPLVEVDWDYLREHGKSIVTPIVITNSTERVIQYEDSKEGIVGETLLMTAFPK
ncbi:PTS glucose transporter subunit IIA [Psychrobacillus sp. FJAT-51614]|uniref:PTS glucose transporter subunit IIA n=1 Tax=Psychrobacillus mangrovi TaxID=3117745 RepID=A0ABU8F8Z3_9BACI